MGTPKKRTTLQYIASRADRLGVTRRTLANWAHVDPGTLSRWISGETVRPVHPAILDCLRAGLDAVEAEKRSGDV